MPKGSRQRQWQQSTKCLEYHSELGKYAAKAFLTYFNKVTWVMTKKGVDDALAILIELRNSFSLLEPSHQKATKPSLGIVQVPKAKTQPLTGEGFLIDDPI